MNEKYNWKFEIEFRYRVPLDCQKLTTQNSFNIHESTYNINKYLIVRT